MASTQTAVEAVLQQPCHAVQSPSRSDTQQEQEDIALDHFASRGQCLGDISTAIDSEPGTPTERPIFRVQERWNSPPENLWKIFCVFFSFINLGMNDASNGALLVYMEAYYNLSYTVISLVFLASWVGYTMAAFTSNWIHHKFGRRGIAILGVLPRLITYIVFAVHPPYVVLVCILPLSGFGIGLLDAGWNAWVGNLAQTNELLGFVHASYGLGATISPLIITAMINKYHLPWYAFYYLMIGLVVLEQACCAYAFRRDNAAKYLSEDAAINTASTQNPTDTPIKAAMKSRVTWICAAFLFAYVGAEVSLGGWVVVFMLRVRHGQPFQSGLTSMGFWLGITVGRLVLGFVTPRIGEKVAVATYLVLGLGLQLIFWLVPQFIVSAVAVGLLGFFMGPLFPASIVACTKILPQRLHVASIGISAAFGGGGAAVLPFAVGAIAQRAGVQALQPIILGLLALLLAIWLSLPRIPRHAHAD